MKKIAFLLFLAMSLPACALDKDQVGKGGTVTDQELEEAASSAFESGDFGKAIDLALPRAEAGDPEFQFSVGYLALMWLEAPAPKEPPRYSLQQALSWIRQAAEQGLPQAAGFLRAGYEWGRYTLPKNPELEECWRKVEAAKQKAYICTAAEKTTTK